MAARSRVPVPPDTHFLGGGRSARLSSIVRDMRPADPPPPIRPSADRAGSFAEASAGTTLARRKAGPKRLSSVATAVRLLKSFSEGEAEIGVTSLARRLGVAKSTVYRLATTLVAEGMLEQNRDNEKYRLGIALFGLGALVRQRMNVSTEARPYLFDLRDATNETVHLALLDGADILYVYDLESNQAIRMRANLGQRKPALATAEGRAMLAFLPETLEEMIGRGFEPGVPKSVTDPDRLRAALEEVRQQRLCPRRRGERIGHAFGRGADPQRGGRGRCRGRRRRSRAAPLRRRAGDLWAARRRDGQCHFPPPRL